MEKIEPDKVQVIFQTLKSFANDTIDFTNN